MCEIVVLKFLEVLLKFEHVSIKIDRTLRCIISMVGRRRSIDGPGCQVQKSGIYTCDKKEKIHKTSKKRILLHNGLITQQRMPTTRKLVLHQYNMIAIIMGIFMNTHVLMSFHVSLYNVPRSSKRHIRKFQRSMG